MRYPASRELFVGPIEEKRKYRRLQRRFKAAIDLPRLSYEIEGETENISPGGALVSTPACSTFDLGDEVAIHLSLPPEWTGQQDTIVLTGPASVRRVDPERKAIAFQFTMELKTFEVSRPHGKRPS
jgi:hypothetical protein